jgi:hypothetical protein
MDIWQNDLTDTLSLDGVWTFSLGEQQGEITVPGAWEAAGYPRGIDGPAEYWRSIRVPAEWTGKRVQLVFDAVSYYTEVSVNGVAVGSHTGMWSPFAFDVTDALRPGEDNDIRLTVWKPGERFPMRESLAGFLPDVVTTFGGIWGSARLVALSGPALRDVQVLPDFRSASVTVRAKVSSDVNELTAYLRLFTPDGKPFGTTKRAPVENGTIELRTDGLLAFQPWKPDEPKLYAIELTLERGNEVLARVKKPFGFRELSRKGETLLFNGAPVCLRGVLNWGWYPETLAPAPNEATIRDEFRRIRELGYNLVKLCLVVPNERYFEIADEEGMLLWLELPMWLPQVTDRLRAQAPLEYADILARLHHHPSIIIYSLGCELNASVDANLLAKLDTIVRGGTSGALLCDNSGSGEAYGGLAHDYADFNDYHFYCDLQYFTPLVDHFGRDFRPARPWIFGEFCDADDYRDLDEIAAANGGALPWWLTEKNPLHPLTFVAYPEQGPRMAKLDIPFSHQELQRISRQQSFALRKTILEKVRSRAGMGGYVVTSLRDTPLATSSMFDDLGRTKYSAEAFRQFNADTVLTLEAGRARTWRHGGDRPAPIDRFNHAAGAPVSLRVILSSSGGDIPDWADELCWRLSDENGQTVAEGQAAVPKPFKNGSGKELADIQFMREIASIEFAAPMVEQAAEYTLSAEACWHGETVARNQWPLWVYPAITVWPEGLSVYDPAGSLNLLDDLLQSARAVTHSGDFDPSSILITSAFTPEVRAFVERGGRALLLQTGAGSVPAQPCPFWREAIKLLYNHPVMNAFPHRGYADLQFYGLAGDYALETTGWADEIQPLLRRLDARQFTLLDYLCEARIGEGRIIASTLRFGGGSGDQPLGLRRNPAGRFLLAQLLAYLKA